VVENGLLACPRSYESYCPFFEGKIEQVDYKHYKKITFVYHAVRVADLLGGGPSCQGFWFNP
jgi:hypothetical protein